MRVRVGCAGWGYDDWVGPFYAPGTPAGKFLAAYGRVFDTVEVDSSYYRAPSREQCARWAATAPEGFAFCPKVPQEIVRERRLRGVEEATGAFLAALEPLAAAGKLGPVLVQLPPSLAAGAAGDLDAFLGLLGGRAVAVEFRHASWWTRGTEELLRRRGAAFVWSWTEHGVPPPILTTDWTYLRLVGDRELTRFHRTQRDVSPLVQDAKDRLRAAGEGLTAAFLIANNHVGGFAPETANALLAALGLPARDLARAARPDGQTGLSAWSG